MNWIDLRSDTVTLPTPEMREAMFAAEVGDDVYGDDPSVNALEEMAADRLGKEAALLVPTGTFGNQLALLTHCRRGDEVLLWDDCHILCHEVGASAVIAGVQARTYKIKNSRLDPAEIKAKIRVDDIHYPPTGLLCLENALGNGRVTPLGDMREASRAAKDAGVPVHLDGARIFNAAAALQVEAKEVAAPCDSVMFCLSKGLCAPVGSMLVGSRDFIAKARKGRKLMGGGMRQAGFLAAAGIVALEKMTARLQKDHDNAKYLGRELAKIPGVEIDLQAIEINMVFFTLRRAGLDGARLKLAMHAKGIKINSDEDGLFRFVTNYWVGMEDIDRVTAALREIAAAG